MEHLKEVVERRLHHEALHQVIPNVKDCKLRMIYEQQGHLFEWSLYQQNKQYWGCLIEHQADEMEIITDQTVLERCKLYELDTQVFLQIAERFFDPYGNEPRVNPRPKKNKSFQAFHLYLEIISGLRESDEALAAIGMELHEAEFIVNLFDRLRRFYEISSYQNSNILWRKPELFTVKELIPLLEGLHAAYLISRKVAKLPLDIAQGLGINRVKMMTGIMWRYLHWQVYTFWHDEYFTLFSYWKTNPDNFEGMGEKLINKANRIVGYRFPKNIIHSDLKFDCSGDRFCFQEEAER